MTRSQFMAAAAADCPDCGAPLLSQTEGASLLVACTKDCGWEVATTNHDVPVFDETPYDVWVRIVDEASTKELAVATQVAVRLGRPARAVLQVIRAKQPILSTAPATDVIALRQLLDGLEVTIRIEPPFQWPL